ncbi:LysM peptidoglycan-binding domain-containing protein [Yoonia sp. SS1-5]|uniref:LysM peptidoglycan-binding domain-containing protein n=1 Tax=Yoonia rhodophyticola TaxID=3137370 RepID=A0AAN0NHD0_9RHOB
MADEPYLNYARAALGVLSAVTVAVAVVMVLPAPTPTAEPGADIAQTPDPAEAVAPAADVAEVAAPAAPAPTPEPPKEGPVFDTFRVETDGNMVIAGRAAPGQIVDIILADEVLARVVADGAGNFVALPQAGPSDQPRKLSLLADPEGDAIASQASFIVSPIAAPLALVADPTVDATDPDAPIDPSATIGDVPAGVAAAQEVPAPGTPAVPQVSVAQAASPLPPTVLQADAGGVRVVQNAPVAPVTAANVALDAITYDPAGEVQLSGRAQGDGAVQIYLDNQPISTSPVTEGGDWRIELPQIDTGVYTLRIDEVDGEGDVVSRLETPFKREEAADVAAVLAEETGQDGFEVAVKTVQPGATLWAIAEENLGDGIFYVEVFAANADLIKDPDLIYPGQIFRIPEVGQ